MIETERKQEDTIHEGLNFTSHTPAQNRDRSQLCIPGFYLFASRPEDFHEPGGTYFNGTSQRVACELIFWEKGRTSFELNEIYDSTELAVQEITEYGWEEDPPTLMQSLFILRDTDTGRVIATGVYQPGTSPRHPDQPDLLWIYSDGKQSRRQCHY
ncbi:MAG: hypothetical protein GY765_19180 [bacterium]|nr:hypothetical protein [bacterium]